MNASLQRSCQAETAEMRAFLVTVVNSGPHGSGLDGRRPSIPFRLAHVEYEQRVRLLERDEIASILLEASRAYVFATSDVGHGAPLYQPP